MKSLKTYGRNVTLLLLAIIVLQCLSARAQIGGLTVFAWGGNSYGQTNLPLNLTNVSKISAGGYHSLVLNRDGSLIAWGDDSSGQSTIPSGLTNVSGIAAGFSHNVVLNKDGTVLAWGSNWSGETNVPSGLSNVVMVAANGCDCLPNSSHSLALLSDSTVVSWGMPQPAGLSNVVSITAGEGHNLVLKSDGSIVGWGENGNGQATPPSSLTGVVAISAGGYHSLALRANGTVFAWGNNAYGQTNVPALVSNAVVIAAGENFSAALQSDGTVVTWGGTFGGESIVPPSLSNVVAIAAGARHFLALANDGSPYFVRRPSNSSAYSGSSVTLDAAVVGVQPIRLQWQLNGTNIDGATNAVLVLTNLQSANAGNYTLIASNSISTNAASAFVSVNLSAPIITSQPSNSFSLIGGTATFSATAVGSLPVSYQWLFNNTPIPDATNASLTIPNAQISNAGSYSVLVSNDFGFATSSNATLYLQGVYAWGAGQTNTGSTPNYGQSIIPTNLSGVRTIAAGGYVSLALLNNGRVSGWGYFGYGLTNIPTGLTNAAAISAGMTHVLALRSNGTVLAWGDSFYNQAIVPTAATNISAVAAGSYHSLALRTNGTVMAWGAGTTSSGSPHFGQSIVPASLSNVIAIAAGSYHSAALRSDGTVIAWGLNASGQTNVPAGLSNVIAIAAGGSNTVALRANGTLLAWGDNSFGQTNVPADLTNVVAVSVGAGHLMALRNDATIEIWGNNGNAQTNVPIVVSNAISISAGANHSLALVNTGPVTFLYPLQNQTVFKGSNALLCEVALGATPISYQWLKDGASISDATNISLAFNSVQLTNSGSYRLVASNRFGSVTSSIVVLTVNDTLPFFVVQPAPQTVLQNFNATMAVTVGGIPPFSYQWRFNGFSIAGATNSTLTVSNVQPANEGNYSVFVTNALGSALSSNAFLDVIDLPQALNATNLSWSSPGQPGWRVESTNTHDGIAAAGIILTNGQSDVAGLQTVVTGPGTVSFWYQVPPGGALMSFNFSVDGAMVYNSANQSLTWVNLSFYIAPGRHVLLWNLGNSAVTGTPVRAYLDQVTFVSGATAPFFTSQPTSQTNSAGNSVTFNASVSGTPPISYLWYFNNTPIPFSTGPYVTLNNIQDANIGNYQLIVSNAGGLASSSNVYLMVIPSTPKITTQPAGISSLIGNSASFGSTVQGTSPLFYQWLRNGSPIPGATNSSLTIDNVQYSDGANYSLFVSNSVGSAVSSNAFLSVYTFADFSSALDNPGISWSTTNVPWFPETSVTHDGISAAQSGVISNSQQSTLQGIVTGPATIVYWWKVNCDSFWVNLAFGLNGTVQNAIAGNVDWQKATNYIGAGAQVLQWNLYPIHGAIAGGTGWVDQVQVALGGTPISILSNPVGVTNTAGNTVSFSVAATGTPPFRYQWSFNGSDIPGATNATLTLVNIQTSNAGTYAAGVNNDYGFATSSNAALVVNASAPVVTGQPTNQAALANSSVTLSVTAKGTTPLSYQWYFNSAAIDGATNSSLVFANVQMTNSGIYKVSISNSLGSVVSSNALLDVHRTRVFDYWPVSQVRYAPPAGLGDVVAIAAGALHSVGLRSDGTVVAWGLNQYGQTNVPPGLANVVEIAAGDTHSVALTATGTVVVWGDDRLTQLEMPAGLSNVVAISAGPAYTLALRNDGSIVGWGDDSSGQTDVPVDVTNAVAVSAGRYNAFALLPNGNVREWGSGPVWLHNGANRDLNIESGLSNVTAVAVNQFSAWVLLSDGSAQPWGWMDGIGPGTYTNNYSIPSSSGIMTRTGTDERTNYPGTVAIASGGSSSGPFYDYALMLLNDGTVISAASLPPSVPVVPANPGHAISLAAGSSHAMALVNDGSPWIPPSVVGRTRTAGGDVTLSAGVVGNAPLSYQWLFNGTNINGGTNAQLVLTTPSQYAGGFYQCIVTNSLGAVTNGINLALTRGVPYMGNGSFMTGDGFHLNVSQLSGHGPIVIYSSTNMADWKPIFTNPPSAGTIEWIDSSATNGLMRFYRANEQ